VRWSGRKVSPAHKTGQRKALHLRDAPGHGVEEAPGQKWGRGWPDCATRSVRR
jgi:hypothetical protein